VGGAPVAVVDVRSTYGHDIDSASGFLQMGMPGLTHNADAWMQAVSQIGYNFNWFYVGVGCGSPGVTIQTELLLVNGTARH
jgi:hypothetical protein